MPFSFPASPSVGQTSTQNSRQYVYVGNNAWELVAPTAIVSSVAGRTGAVTLTAADVSGVAASSATGITGATAITNIVSMSQSSYDAIGSKSSTTLYIING
jgi:hypothetical protein